ncbi:MAG TPA: hypothetical protein VEB59_02180 [Gemmatimonadales bacterium]|nr:hypothetical protein [Gemmatimonadales bacterium]
MSSPSSLDIRMPIGMLFTLLGLVLGGYGLATGGEPAMYAQSLSLNLNLWWGLVMLLFGVVMLSAAWSGGKPAGAAPADETPEGRATEQRERRRGLEG